MNIKKFATSAASVITAGALIVGGTMAYFTDTDTSTGNTLGAGSLEIELQTLGRAHLEGEAFFTANNMMPGDEPVSSCAAVANVGTLDFNWTMKGTDATATTPSLVDVLWGKTYAWVGEGEADCEATEGWELIGGMGLPISLVVDVEGPRGLLAGGATEYFKWEYWLPASVGSEYMGAQAVLDMEVKAYQTNDPAYPGV